MATHTLFLSRRFLDEAKAVADLLEGRCIFRFLIGHRRHGHGEPVLIPGEDVLRDGDWYILPSGGLEREPVAQALAVARRRFDPLMSDRLGDGSQVLQLCHAVGYDGVERAAGRKRKLDHIDVRREPGARRRMIEPEK